LHTHPHKSISHKSQKVETTHVYREMNRLKNVAYTCNPILFSLKKEGNSDSYYNMYKTFRHYAKWKKPISKGEMWSQSYEISRVVSS
jgi:hypothetical protein